MLLDIAMPGIDGYELARLLRSYTGTRSIRLIAISAHAFNMSAQAVPPGGWDACLGKPCEPETLIATVTSVLSARPPDARSGPVLVPGAPPSSRNGTGGDG